MDITALALELRRAYADRQILQVPISAREPGFDLDAAYAVAAELVRLRRADGRTTVGRKVGYASRGVWRALRLDTLVWAPMYDDTVMMALTNEASLPLSRMCAPKIEPEIVFKLRESIADDGHDPGAILESVEWLALGFEIVDSVFAGWTFQPSDFVAAYGLHAALLVGRPQPVEAGRIPSLVEHLAVFPVRLQRNGETVAEGSGRNSLRSPVLCLGELASAIARRQGAEPLRTGELVSSGSLTEPQPLAPGETWTVSVERLGLPDLTLRTT